MLLYLVQHGEAKGEEEDPSRSLTEKGRADAEKTARYAAKIGINVSEIAHSPKLRAKQTAEVFASYLKAGVKEMAGITPNDDPEIARKYIESAEKDIILVGHLPHLGKLASLLLVNDANATIVAFQMAGILCLEKKEKWQVKFMLIPETVI
jgi:phosphohistidine phosphatase